jgi:hypothetical protein
MRFHEPSIDSIGGSIRNVYLAVYGKRKRRGKNEELMGSRRETLERNQINKNNRNAVENSTVQLGA